LQKEGKVYWKTFECISYHFHPLYKANKFFNEFSLSSSRPFLLISKIQKFIQYEKFSFNNIKNDEEEGTERKKANNNKKLQKERAQKLWVEASNG